MTERFAPSGVIYYEAQASAIAAGPARTTNPAIMHQHEDITRFQTAVQRAVPVQHQRRDHRPPHRRLRRGDADEDHVPERPHQRRHVPPREHAPVVGRQRLRGPRTSAPSSRRATRTCRRTTTTARTAANNAGGLGTPAGDAAFEARLVDALQQHLQRHRRPAPWNVGAVEPDERRTCSDGNQTYTRSGQVLHRAAPRSSARTTSPRPTRRSRRNVRRRFDHRSRSMIAESTRSTCRTRAPAATHKLDAFFQQWWDTAYTGSPAAGQQAADHGSRASPAAASTTPTAAARTTAVVATSARPVPRDAEPDARHAGQLRPVHARASRTRTRRPRRRT